MGPAVSSENPKRMKERVMNMRSNNKSPSIYTKAVLKEASQAVSAWALDIDKALAISQRIAGNKNSLLLQIALETETSEFVYDLDEKPESVIEGDAQIILSALSKHIQEHAVSLASKNGWKGEGLQSALLYLSDKGMLSGVKEYIEGIRSDLEDFMKG